MSTRSSLLYVEDEKCNYVHIYEETLEPIYDERTDKVIGYNIYLEAFSEKGDVNFPLTRTQANILIKVYKPWRI